MVFVAVQNAIVALGLNYGVHYASAKLYDTYCVPHSLEQVVHSLVATGSPVCSFLIHSLHATQTNYASTISVSVASLISSGLKFISG